MLPLGTSDKLRTSRVKVYCPRCEETYLPHYKNLNLDGSFFTTGLPHAFILHYGKSAITLPPKVYYYQPKIFGFKLFNKRGSKFYKSTNGPIRYTEDDEDVDKLIQ